MEDLFNSVKELIRPELLCLVPVLYLIGVWMKKSSHVKDKNIPLILGVLGVALAAMWSIASGEVGALNIIFTSITQGIMCAGVSVYVNQIIKQRRKYDE